MTDPTDIEPVGETCAWLVGPHWRRKLRCDRPAVATATKPLPATTHLVYEAPVCARHADEARLRGWTTTTTQDDEP